MANRTHFILSDVPVMEKITTSICDTKVEKLRELATDADLQDFDLNQLTRCKKCQAAPSQRYCYLGREIA